MTADASSAGGKVLEDLIARLEGADDLDAAFFQEIVDRATGRDPELPDLLRAAAIPRALDAEVVGVLRGTPDDDEGNARLLEMLAEYRFVVSRPDGRLVYHDNTRDAALADWRSSDEKRAAFVALNHALAAHYQGRYAKTNEDQRHLDRVTAVMAAANPRRLHRLTRATDAAMADALLEALYHRLLVSPQDGVDFFRDSFYSLEDVGRLSVCRSLVIAVRDFLERLPPGEQEPGLLAWCDYFEARIRRSIPGGDTAAVEQTLSRLLAEEDLPEDLRVWALDDLAIVYESQFKVDQAVATRLELTEQESGDPFNDPLRHSAFGGLYWSLGDFGAAERQYQLAIEKVEREQGARQDMGVLARLDLSAVRTELAEWPSAFDAALEALDRARSAFREDRVAQQHAAMRLARLLAPFDIRASDTAAAEAIALCDRRPDQRFVMTLRRMGMLLEVGRLRRATAVCEALSGGSTAVGAGGAGEAAGKLDLDLRRALLLHRGGREAEASELYADVIAQTAGDPAARESRLAARMARGISLVTRGELAEAERELAEVRDAYRSAGAMVHAGTAAVQLAGAAVLRHDLEAARALLDEADAALPPGFHPDRGDVERVRGEVSERTGDWRAARGHYAAALRISAAKHDVPTQALVLRKLAEVAASSAAFDLAADYGAAAAAADAEVAAWDREDQPRERPADELNAEGVRRFCDPEGGAGTLDEARQFLRAAADHDPGNLWPLLNLSFVYAHQQDWAGAAEALTRVLDLAPDPMRGPWLSRTLGRHVLAHAQVLARRREPARAAAAITAALPRLVGAAGAGDLVELRVLHAALLAVADAGDAARAAFRAAAGGDGVVPTLEAEDLAVTMADAIVTPADYWAVDEVLADLERDTATETPVPATARATREALAPHLDRLLALGPDSRFTGEGRLPVVTPIVGEVGDGLVSFVDSRQDGGHFLFELVPGMRERIRASTGVTVPGVRMRLGLGLPPNGYAFQIDEVQVLAGVAPHVDEEAEDAAALVQSIPEDLVRRLELTVRAHLRHFVGLPEVTDLLETWAQEDDTGLVGAVVPDDAARDRLTWVLQDLVAEGVPIGDWRAVLETIRDAGGVSSAAPTLRRAVRARLRAELPGRGGRLGVRVPAEHETALLGDPAAAADRGGPPGDAARDLLRWLRQTVAQSGSGVALVASSDEARERIASVVRAEDPSIPTLSADELR